jgi:hypothetical protein
MRRTKILMIAVLLFAASARASDFEIPPQEPAATSLPAGLVSGPNFHIREPVESDGLMHRYVVDSKFGMFPAYGQETLKIRIREVAALTQISKTTAIDVLNKSVEASVRSDVKTVSQVATNPVKTIVGIPKGVGHLFNGYKAQGNEFVSDQQSHTGANRKPDIGTTAKNDAAKYADRYLGVSAAERRYYKELGVDPYTDNAALRKAVTHLAKVNAAVNVGMHFVPGLPYLGDVRRAMDAIYNEDPAVLRARQRVTLTGYGLSSDEIRRFENTLLLSPTRQALLEEAAKRLDGVAGRDELFRHAMSVTSEEEMQVFLMSAGMLAALHAQHPVARILSGLRLPSAQTGGGGIIVPGVFDSVYWTEQVAGYEATLHAALPEGAKDLQIWVSGDVSPRARNELTMRGWTVHDRAALAQESDSVPRT